MNSGAIYSFIYSTNIEYLLSARLYARCWAHLLFQLSYGWITQGAKSSIELPLYVCLFTLSFPNTSKHKD